MQDALAMKQVEVLLDMQTKKLLGEIQSLRAELSQIKGELSGLKEVRRQDPPVSIPEPAARPAAGPTEFQPRATAPASKPIDRNGVAPEDVSIEKFFYVGGK